MGAGTFRTIDRRARLAVALAALALLLRILVPAGFMPVAGQGFAITLCTGEGAVAAWVDGDGTLRKGKPGPARMADQPCAFAGFAAALDLPGLPVLLAAPLPIAGAPLPALLSMVAIGRGLAAPPPPPTGPPAFR